jgi:hypothetical protein
MSGDVVVLRRESIVTIVEGEPTSPVIEVVEAPAIVIQREGIPGARGETGASGEFGGATFIFTPEDVSASWLVAHNLNKFPSVDVVDTSGRRVMPDVTYLDSNVLTLDFDIPMTGSAYLN